MKGYLLTFNPFAKGPDVVDLTAEPPLEDIKAQLGGGYLEVVPGFTSMEIGDKRFACVAFCDEDGKGKKLDWNVRATDAWQRALVAQGIRGCSMLRAVDWLVGPVVVLAGDAEFMGSLCDDEED